MQTKNDPFSTQKNVLKHITLRANKIAQKCFLEVVFGNRFMKGAMIRPFYKAHCSKSSISSKTVKKKCLSKFLMKFISRNLSKQMFGNRSIKGLIISSFCRAPCS